MILSATQRFMADRMKARTVSHPVDHAPLVSAPGAVADIILEAWSSAAPKLQPDQLLTGYEN